MASQSSRINDISALINEHLNGQSASKNQKLRQDAVPAGIFKDEYVAKRFIKSTKLNKLVPSDTPKSGFWGRIISFFSTTAKIVNKEGMAEKTCACSCKFFKERSSAEKTPIKSKEELKKESELTHKQLLYQDLGLTKTSRANFFSGDVKYDHFLKSAHANPAILLMAIMLKLVREGYSDLKTKLNQTIGMLNSMSQENLRISRECKMAAAQNIR